MSTSPICERPRPQTGRVSARTRVGGILLWVLAAVVLATGTSAGVLTPCSDWTDQLRSIEMASRFSSMQTVRRIVLDAASLSEQEHHGLFPATPAGFSSYYLPDQTYFINPVNGDYLNPVDRSAAVPGEIGYLVTDSNGDGINDGAIIDEAPWPFWDVVIPVSTTVRGAAFGPDGQWLPVRGPRR